MQTFARLTITAALAKAVAAGNPAQIAILRGFAAELASRDDRIEQLEGELGLRLPAPARIRIAPYPLKILGMLMRAEGWLSYASIETGLYGHLPECDWPLHPGRSIKVHVHHLRRALDTKGITFETIFAAAGCGGYFMPADMKARAREVLGLGASFGKRAAA